VRTFNGVDYHYYGTAILERAQTIFESVEKKFYNVQQSIWGLKNSYDLCTGFSLNLLQGFSKDPNPNSVMLGMT